jgi:hypothetical protein
MDLSEGAGLVDQAGQCSLEEYSPQCDGAAGAVFGVDCVGHLAARLDIAGRDDDLCPLLCHPLDDRAPIRAEPVTSATFPFRSNSDTVVPHLL